MKKIINILLVAILILPIGISKVFAEEIEPYGVIYCDSYKGKHKMYYFGSGDIYDEGGDVLIRKGFRFYKCVCGKVIFSNNTPEKNNNIPGYFIETNTRMENLYDGYIVYKLGHTNGKIGTNLLMNRKTTPMTSCVFYYS